MNVAKVKLVLVTLGFLLLASCVETPLPQEVNGPSITDSRVVEHFMPGVEAVEVEEDFSQDPQYETVSEAFEAWENSSFQTQGVTGNTKVQLRTHTFSNGEKYRYSIYNGVIFDGDVILGTSKELQADIAAYEEYLASSKSSEGIETQGAMYKPFCSSQFLFVCNERRGGGWPGGILYVDSSSLSSNFTSSQQTSIRNALTTLDNATDITVRYTTTGDRVKLTNKEDGCYAVPGRSSKQPQILNLADGCVVSGTIIHEFGHALGLMHEHQRTDRDSFIVINTSNLTSKGLDNMRPKIDHESRTTYDYASIMHYPRTTSDSTFVKSTAEPILTIVGSYTGMVGGSVLTSRDIQAINARY